MSDRKFLSIGEVLDLLKQEFPDVTISKIRFLESQGLLDPERTPSGYRKFYDTDVERLRWILRQQRENFLPLKVIKGRLEASHGNVPVDVEPEDEVAEADGAATGEAEAPPPEPVPSHADGPSADANSIRVPGAASVRAAPLETSITATTFTLDELTSASGLTTEEVADLERYGLLGGRSVGGRSAGGTVYYDEDCLIVARLAASFARHGVGARHLRMFRMAADREAGFYEQVVLPYMKQRNPTARRQAMETLAELAKLGEGMRGALLRGSLRQHTDTP